MGPDLNERVCELTKRRKGKSGFTSVMETRLMTKGLLRALALLFSVGLIGNSQATLLDRGNGMVYDTDQDLTWLKDTNIAKTRGHGNDGKLHVTEVMDWVNSFEYAGYSDWRLPEFDLQACYNSAIFIDEFQCLTDDTSTGEITFMHNQILGNSFWLNRNNARDCPDLFTSANGCLVNTGADGVAFDNFTPDFYWVTNVSNPGVTFSFNPADGSHHENWGDFADAYAWLVRTGDVAAAVPEPRMLLLLAAGLIGLGVAKRART